MDRRKALMALGCACIGILSGQAKFVSSKEVTYEGKTKYNFPSADTKLSIIWEMDETADFVIRFKGQTITIKVSEIFEALKEGR